MSKGHGCRAPGLGAAAVIVSSWMISSFMVVPRAQDRRHTIGQTVTPAFEGWFKNADGSFGLVYGYFNRNFEEAVDIPVGPDNRIEPGEMDQGQPTHFLPRRQVGAFTIIVPASFGTRTVTWTLVNRGEKLAVPGYLRPEWQITPFENPTDGRRPPRIRFARSGEAFEGPAGARTVMTARANQPATLALWVEPNATRPPAESPPASDGRGGKPPATPLEWSRFRGDGEVRFSTARPETDESGAATTTVTFGKPGTYVLRLLAGSAATTGCCWTNGYVSVNVN